MSAASAPLRNALVQAPLLKEWKEYPCPCLPSSTSPKLNHSLAVFKVKKNCRASPTPKSGAVRALPLYLRLNLLMLSTGQANEPSAGNKGTQYASSAAWWAFAYLIRSSTWSFAKCRSAKEGYLVPSKLRPCGGTMDNKRAMVK